MKLKLFLIALVVFSSGLFLSGKSFSELYDGEKVIATFSAANWGVEDESEEPESQGAGVLLYANASDTQVGYVANNVSDYDKLKYQITYSHETEFGTIDELIEGETDNSSHDNIVSDEWFILGSQSSGGTTVYYTGIPQVNISLDLVVGDTTIQTINDTLVF